MVHLDWKELFPALKVNFIPLLPAFYYFPIAICTPMFDSIQFEIKYRFIHHFLIFTSQYLFASALELSKSVMEAATKQYNRG